MLEFLEKEQISEELIKGIEGYRKEFPTPPELADRVPEPHFHYYGKEVWEEAIAALLCGQNLLLAGPKATGKNVLAENLACVFGRPMWNVSFHINMDATGMLGTDTFKNGEVEFRPARCTSAPSMAASGCLMKSTWPGMKPWLYSILCWIFVIRWTSQAMTGSMPTRPAGSLPP